MKKRFLTSILSMSILMGGISVHAAGTGDDQSPVKDIHTLEQLDAIAEKEKAIKEMNEAFSNPDGYYKVLSVPSYEQQTSYWCGPATVKQVLGFLNGTSSTQAIYASALGTTENGTVFNNIDTALNKYQTKNVYANVSIGDYASWSGKVKYSLDKNLPPLLDLRISPSYMPKYTRAIDGHILNVSGVDSRQISSSEVLVRLTDPFDQDGRGVTLGNIWHPHKGVYNSNNAHPIKSIIY